MEEYKDACVRVTAVLSLIYCVLSFTLLVSSAAFFCTPALHQPCQLPLCSFVSLPYSPEFFHLYFILLSASILRFIHMYTGNILEK